MRRTSCLAGLIVVAAFGLASCASSLDAGSGGTTSAPKSSTTKKAASGGGAGDPNKCSAIKGYQSSFLIAMKPEMATKDAVEKDKVISGLTTAGDKLKKTVPSLNAEVDLQVPYLTKLVKGEPTTPADKAGVDTAKDKMNLMRAQFCQGDNQKPTTTKKP